MSYVAHPFEQYFDDLLTALTGGISREEHQFLGPDIPYALAVPGAKPETVRVCGQSGEMYRLFDPVRDFAYSSADEAVHWLPKGRTPDEGSRFYVRYYPDENRASLTDRNPGSVNFLIAGAFARQYTVVSQQMETIYRSAFSDLADGPSLDHVAALFGIDRRGARSAMGEVLFSRATPAPADISLPAGTLVSTADGRNFETRDRRTLRRGQLSVSVPVRAQVEGPLGRVDRAAISLMNRPLFGIDQVSNQQATFFAAEKETDDELRRRIKATLERAGRATVDAIRYGLIEDLPEVTETNVQVTERAETPGLVEVRLGLDSAAADGDLVRRVEESLLAARPAGVRVVHNLHSRTPNSATNQARGPRPMPLLSGSRRAVTLPAAISARLPPDLLPLRAEIRLRYAEQNLSAAQREAIEEGARTALTSYMDSLTMGGDIIYYKIIARLLEPEAVADASLYLAARVPDAAAPAGANWYAENLATENRKASLSPADCFVGPMDEIVNVQARIALSQKTTGAAPAKDALAAAKIIVEAAINRAIAAVYDAIARQHDAGAAAESFLLSRAALIAEARTALDAASSEFVLAPDRPVVINADFTESGRRLADAAEIPLLTYQIPFLTKLDIDAPEGI